jgi:nucleotide-binding universal stress UspA family protein
MVVGMTARWIVGIDVRDRCEGAVQFGAWLHASSRGALELLGVHAIETAELDEGAQLLGHTRARERLRLTAEKLIERAEAGAAFVGVEIVDLDRPEVALETALRTERGRGLIVGRRAPGEGDEIIRLGRVTRRLLRRLVAPVFVVPPDLEKEAIGAGPLVVAVTPGEASVGAVKVARSLGEAIGRPRVFVHVVPVIADYTGRRESMEAEAVRASPRVQAAEEKVRAWLAAQGAEGEVRVVGGGEVLTKTVELARQLKAPFIACGSRSLSLVERVFGLSQSSELAAQASGPVLVVPSDAAG